MCTFKLCQYSCKLTMTWGSSHVNFWIFHVANWGLNRFLPVPLLLPSLPTGPLVIRLSTGSETSGGTGWAKSLTWLATKVDTCWRMDSLETTGAIYDAENQIDQVDQNRGLSLLWRHESRTAGSLTSQKFSLCFVLFFSPQFSLFLEPITGRGRIGTGSFVIGQPAHWNGRNLQTRSRFITGTDSVASVTATKNMEKSTATNV